MPPSVRRSTPSCYSLEPFAKLVDDRRLLRFRASKLGSFKFRVEREKTRPEFRLRSIECYRCC